MFKLGYDASVDYWDQGNDMIVDSTPLKKFF